MRRSERALRLSRTMRLLRKPMHMSSSIAAVEQEQTIRGTIRPVHSELRGAAIRGSGIPAAISSWLGIGPRVQLVLIQMAKNSPSKARAVT